MANGTGGKVTPIAAATARLVEGAMVPGVRPIRREWTREALIHDMRNFGDLFRFLDELLDNSLRDHKASEVRILIDRRSGRATVRIEENGVGMTAERRDAFASYGKSTSAGRPGMSGRTGRGFRCAAFGGAGCTRIAVDTVSEEHPDHVVRFEFSIVQYTTPPGTGGVDEITPEVLPRSAATFPYPTGTGVVFTLSGFEEPSPVFEDGKPRVVPPDDEVREYIGQRHPFLAAQVTVNGKRCTPRKIEGEHLRTTVATKAGPVEVSVHILAQSEPDLRLEFPPMGMKEFYTALVRHERRHRVPEDKRISKRFPSELLDERVVGVIAAPVVHTKFKTAAQHSLLAQVFTSPELRAVVVEAFAEVSRWVQPRLVRASSDAESAELDDLLEQFMATVNARYQATPSMAPGGGEPGNGPTGPVARPVTIELHPHEVTLEVGGEQQLFSTASVPRDAEVRWTVTGGDLAVDVVTEDHRQRGVRLATFTSGDQEGTFVLQAAIIGDPTQHVEARILLRRPFPIITAPGTKALRLFPTRKVLAPNGLFYLRTYDGESKVPTTRPLVWVSSDPSCIGVKPILNPKDGTPTGQAEVYAQGRIGRAEVIVRAVDGSDGGEVRCRVEVRAVASLTPPGSCTDQPGGGGQHPSARGGKVTIRDRTYVVRITLSGGAKPVYRAIDTRSGLPALNIDADFAAMRTAQRPHTFLRELLHAVVREYAHDVAVDDPTRSFDDLHAIESEVLVELTTDRGL